MDKANAFKFIFLLGIVSLFADMTYEGARSITGPFLAILGANAAVVGFVSGLGELLGYGFRVFSGYMADRTKQYWNIVLIGYVINLLAVPLLALAGEWWIAAALMIAERLGKAIRVPPRDAMISQAGHQVGMGWAFGLHEALDQTGAMIGPLIVAFVLYLKQDYAICFAWLLIPAMLSLSALLMARIRFPQIIKLEIREDNFDTKKTSKALWMYIVSASLVAAGYADFPLLAYHFQKTESLPEVWIPILYAIAMGANAISAPLLGKLYDWIGFKIIIIVTLLTCAFVPFVFLGNTQLIVLGVILWSIGMGAHESLMRAIVADLSTQNKRASAYGMFNLCFGISWFLGSVLMGILYDISIYPLILFSILIQLCSIPIFIKTLKIIK